jgi:hypothetical protein
MWTIAAFYTHIHTCIVVADTSWDGQMLIGSF